MVLQQTSLDAYKDISPYLNTRQRVVLDAISSLEEANNLMISKFLSLPINLITPRVLELRIKGLVVESYRDLCPYTKRTTIFWRVK